ncbi:MMPL family transporter [Halodesulfovibrio aestuarii]|uniref:MMPL family transporter n=1 Tax=Halodesulfovibrio aestuarii TaxID=126333 RepID=UPI003D3347AC
MIRFVSNAYIYLAQRKWLLLLVMGGMMLCCVLSLSSMKLEERISYLLPDDKSVLSNDLDLIQSAPLQHRILITLHVVNDDLVGAPLAKLTDQLTRTMQSSFFTKVACKPDSLNPNFFIGLRDLVPSLFSNGVQNAVSQAITADNIAKALTSQKHTLGTMEGVLKASTIAADPLNLHRTALRKIASLAYMKNLRILHGVYMTEDGKHSLIMATTPVMTTDSRASVALEQELERISNTLPKGVTWTVLGAQRYTAANALTIKNDIKTTSVIACIALLGIVVCFLRTKQVFFLLLLPLLSYCAGAAAVATGWKPASAMTFGFGPILVGMTIDFGLHLYYVLGSNTAPKRDLLQKASVPIVISGLTTIAAFALLMFSPVPGLRQLSVFITIGLLTAVVLTLFILPHVISGHPGHIASKPLPQFSHNHRAAVLTVTAVVFILGCVGSSQLHFQDHIRAMGVRPAALLQAEKDIRNIWGIKGEEALLFASGTSIDEVVRKTSDSIALLSPEDKKSVVSLTPLLPSRQRQQENWQHWRKFWEAHPSVASTVQAKGVALGFSKHAFTPFYDFIHASPQAVTVGSLRNLGIGSLLDSLLVERSVSPQTEIDVEGTSGLPMAATSTVGYSNFSGVLDTSNFYTLISYLPDTHTINSVFTPEIEKKYDVRLISGSRLGKELASVLTGTFVRFIAYAFAIIVVIILLVHRVVKQCICALLPACFGLLMMGGVLGLLNRPLSIFSVAGALLVLGHGVDYGVYATHAIKKNSLGTSQAIFVSGLTSLAGFGSLLFADHPALFDMGLSVFSGLLAAMPCALLVLPALFSKDTISS